MINNASGIVARLNSLMDENPEAAIDTAIRWQSTLNELLEASTSPYECDAALDLLCVVDRWIVRSLWIARCLTRRPAILVHENAAHTPDARRVPINES